MAKKAWTDYRKVMSNLTPLAMVAPLPAVAWYLDKLEKPSLALVVWCLCPIVLWLGINNFGLFQNSMIRKELLPKLPKDLAGRSVFVGFGRTGHAQLIHHHEDVGWFLLNPDSVEFIGDSHHHKIKKEDIQSIRLGMNINSILWLGRWMKIEGKVDKKRVCMLIECREKRTMFANFKFTKELCERVREWKR